MDGLKVVFALVGWLFVGLAALMVPAALFTMGMSLIAAVGLLNAALMCGVAYAVCDIAVNTRRAHGPKAKPSDEVLRGEVGPERLDARTDKPISPHEAVENMKRNRAAAREHHLSKN